MTTTEIDSSRDEPISEMDRSLCGRSERIRTSDPLVPNEVRYQTALHSDTTLLGGSDARL